MRRGNPGFFRSFLRLGLSLFVLAMLAQLSQILSPWIDIPPSVVFVILGVIVALLSLAWLWVGGNCVASVTSIPQDRVPLRGKDKRRFRRRTKLPAVSAEISQKRNDQRVTRGGWSAQCDSGRGRGPKCSTIGGRGWRLPGRSAKRASPWKSKPGIIAIRLSIVATVRHSSPATRRSARSPLRGEWRGNLGRVHAKGRIHRARNAPDLPTRNSSDDHHISHRRHPAAGPLNEREGRIEYG